MASPLTTTNDCLFNLMIYTNCSQRAQYFHEITNVLINKFPCRVIFIELDEEMKQESPEISKTKGNQRCDQIHIKASPANLGQVPYTLLTILVPDLPVYLIWGESPTANNTILPEFLKLATRIIYDSECTENMKQFCNDILTNFLSENIEFMDIDWALIRGWREVIAKTFDSAEKMEMLLRSKSIQIHYNEIPSVFIKHSSTRAFYLQGWLAAMLGWEFVSKNAEKTLTYKKRNQEVSIVLVSQQNSNVPPGTITKVIFQTDQEEEIVISKITDHSMVLIHITRGDKCELPFNFRLPNFQRGLSFIKEIFYYRTSDHYKKMLETLQNIDWKA